MRRSFRRTFARSLAMAAGLLLFALGATGCFQSVGAALLATNTPAGVAMDPLALDATNQAAATTQALAMAATQIIDQATLQAVMVLETDAALTQTALVPLATLTETPTSTPFETPTEVAGGNAFPPTVIVFATETPTATLLDTSGVFLPTWTQTPPFILPQATFTPQPTFTPLPTLTPPPTYTPLPTYTPFPTFTPLPTLTAFPTVIAALPTQDPNTLTILQRESPTPFIPTLDPVLAPIAIAAIPTQAPTVQIDTAPVLAATPTPVSVAQIDPTQEALYGSATAIIATVTANAAAFQTQTAVAGGAPPIVDPNAGQPPIVGTAPSNAIVITLTPAGTWGAAGTGASGPLDGNIYTVQRGDRLLRIALRFGTTVERIASANGIINVNDLTPGQKLRIPGVVVTPQPPVAMPNAITLAPGATIDPRAIIIIITATPPGGSPGAGRVYIVQEGDTLYGIATRFRVSVTALAQYNGISNIGLIYMGQRLLIP